MTSETKRVETYSRSKRRIAIKKRHPSGKFHGDRGSSYDISNNGVVHVNALDLMETPTFNDQLSAASRVIVKSRAARAASKKPD